MAAKSKSSDGVRLTHSNGAAVVVSADKAERLTAAGAFTAAKAATKADTK